MELEETNTTILISLNELIKFNKFIFMNAVLFANNAKKYIISRKTSFGNTIELVIEN